MESEYTIIITKEEYDYLTLVLSNLIDLEKRISIKYKTNKSRVLEALQSKLAKVGNN